MIIKADHESRGHFVILDTRAARDPRLSFRARGLHTYLMTQHETWEIRLGQLVKDSKEGREAIRVTIRELEAAGYIERRQTKAADGTFSSTEMILFEISRTSVDHRGPETRPRLENDDQPSPRKPSPGKPSPGNRPLTKDQENKDQLNQITMIVPGAPKEGLRKDIRDRSADEIALANIVQLGLFASDALKAAWTAWAGYRTDRATRPLAGEKRSPWTERAAEAAKRNVEALCAKWGDETTIELINKSIDRRWLDVYSPKAPSELRANPAAMTDAQLKIF